MGYLAKGIIGAAIGVAAVAAVPFTGGGSVLGGISLGAALAGSGGTAVAAAGVGAGVGAAIQGKEDIEKIKEIKKAKKSSFEDGLNKGRELTIEEIKKYADFCLATTALSYWVARIDGSIDEAEKAELDFDLDTIKKNKDLPDGVKNELVSISEDENISFKDVKKYLDKVSVKTLEELKNDIDEIIIANGQITPSEKKAKAKFDKYIKDRGKHEG